ncbi:MGMT family protein [Candidatus Dojkabacteria bacterium]|nr:MGMT family protein [Candidatus Dojkabacteria bacterium]
MSRKTAREMIESKTEVYFDENVEPRGNWKLHGKMVIPPAPEYEDVMKKVPEGKLLTQDVIRNYFAKKYNADFCCPLVTGIFVNLVAKAAEEDIVNQGKKIDEVTPYWRTLKTDGELNPKYPGGIEAQAAKLKAEGHEIELSRTGKPKSVKDFDKKIHNILA